MMYRGMPFIGNEIFDKVLQPPSQAGPAGQDCWDCISNMLDRDKQQRPTADDVLAYNWLAART